MEKYLRGFCRLSRRCCSLPYPHSNACEDGYPDRAVRRNTSHRRFSGAFDYIRTRKVLTLTNLRQVYRTFIVWNSNVYVIVLPCATLLATFGKLRLLQRYIDDDGLSSLRGYIFST